MSRTKGRKLKMNLSYVFGYREVQEEYRDSVEASPTYVQSYDALSAKTPK